MPPLDQPLSKIIDAIDPALPVAADPRVLDRFTVDHPADLERGTADEHQLRRRRHGQTYTVVGRWTNQVIERVVVHFDLDPRHKTISWPLHAMASDIPSDTVVPRRAG